MWSRWPVKEFPQWNDVVDVWHLMELGEVDSGGLQPGRPLALPSCL